MGYTDLVSQFAYKDPWFWQRMDALAENDKANLLAFAIDRRPVLKYIDKDTVDVESNASVANQTRIVFTDNEIRTVLEDTSVTSSYRRLIISETASFVSGSENSGLRSGYSLTGSKQWLFVYAVKSQINTSNFVLVADETIPTRSNYSTLNGYYGTHSWIYLGALYLGTPITFTGPRENVFPFVQVGNLTIFKEIDTLTLPGPKVDSGNLDPSRTFSPVVGTGPTDIPTNFTSVKYAVGASGTSSITLFQVKGTPGYFLSLSKPNLVTAIGYVGIVESPVNDGIFLNTDYSSGSSSTGTISIYGFTDGALGVGCNSEL